jgi:hypothetical protein
MFCGVADNGQRSMSEPTPIPDDLPPDWREQDSILSYYAAIDEIRRRVEAGAPIPSTGYFGTARRGG